MKKSKNPHTQNDNFKVSDTTALIYARVSSTRQKLEGHGLESQVHRCLEFAKAKGWNVSDEAIFKDDFTGGGDFMNRPAMRQLISHVESASIQEVRHSF